MATSIGVAEVKSQIGQDTPQDQDQELTFEIWKRLPEEWLSEDDFTEQLAKISGLTEGWQGHDVSALIVSLHSPGWIEIRRTGRLDREMRKSAERPRFYSFVERSENDASEMVAWQQAQKDAELERAEEARRELQRPQIQAEREEISQQIDDHPRVRELQEEVKDLESEVRGLRAKVALLESKFGGEGGGTVTVA
jgi:hypothetical protein